MSTGTQRILVVDDELDIRELFAAGLSQQGFECLMAADADQASNILAKEDVDLVLFDIMMLGKSGMELLSEIVDEHPQVAVIMVSAVGDIATGRRSHATGGVRLRHEARTHHRPGSAGRGGAVPPGATARECRIPEVVGTDGGGAYRRR